MSRPSTLTPEQIAWAAEQYNAGVTLRDIGFRLAVSHSYIHQALRTAKLISATRKRKADVDCALPRAPRRWVPKPAKAKAVRGPNVIAGITLARLMGRRA